ncbi:UDP-glucuronosyltransferase 1A1-like [Cheilinus undulatus]|uniref:UDP-glucuronosyltransferase 1A1-like n=1 Tax=Cheilinus undulatus TaxID=241271 RepID=UPI001BD6315D|nr:UDP-glucuronosyltransferase 1A1-like [Cheilinus undulatus]
MWKAVVFVFLLLNMGIHVDGAADKKLETVAKTSKPEQKGESEAVTPSPVSSLAPAAFKGKLLVIPMDGSHWVGMKALAQEMGRRGHQVTVVIPEVTMRMGPGKHYDTITFPVPYDKTVVDQMMASNKAMMDNSDGSFIERMKNKFSHIQKIRDFIHLTSELLLFNDTLILHLAQQGFDAVLTDPMIPVGALIARKLGLPIINVLRAIPCSLDWQASGCPAPPSYVPRFFTGNTDKMNFMERTINTVVASLEPLMCKLFYWQFDNMAYRFLGEEVGVAEVLSDSAIWLFRFDFTLELPRPLMPNMVLIGGINCNVRNPLPKDLESWVSGEHGFIVFTLGSMMSDMPEETTLIFLEAFRRIPQKVIWRYEGKIPDNVPENVKMMSWVPQNDLLAQPGVRAFITHGGSHGLFEGLCHAVPMVMVPIAGDQPDNTKRFASKGVGVVLDIYTVTPDSLVQALNEVINDSRYKENLQVLSALHKDRPMDPVDLSVFWTEFVMRHKGAKHLRAAVHDLYWFQYFCLDVIAFLATVVFVFVMLTVKCFKMCFRKLRRKRKQE